VHVLDLDILDLPDEGIEHAKGADLSTVGVIQLGNL